MIPFTKRSICRCDHIAPSLPELRSVEFNCTQAERLDALGMSSPAIGDTIWNELFRHRTGKLVDTKGNEIVLGTDDPVEVRDYDASVSEARRHFVKRYRARASKGGFSNRLQDRLIDPVTMMFLALEVRDCRLSGNCACPHLPKRHVDPIRFDD